MAQPPYSHKLLLVHDAPRSNYSIIIPDTVLWVVRTITIFAPGGDLSNNLQIVDSLTSATIFWWANLVNVNGFYDVFNDLRIVGEPGDVWELTSTPPGCDVGLYGYLFAI